jgi:hypothetical protein
VEVVTNADATLFDILDIPEDTLDVCQRRVVAELSGADLDEVEVASVTADDLVADVVTLRDSIGVELNANVVVSGDIKSRALRGSAEV